jgi:hypothetical protein
MVRERPSDPGEGLFEGERQEPGLGPGGNEATPDREPGGVWGGGSSHVRAPCGVGWGRAPPCKQRDGVRNSQDAL